MVLILALKLKHGEGTWLGSSGLASEERTANDRHNYLQFDERHTTLKTAGNFVAQAKMNRLLVCATGETSATRFISSAVSFYFALPVKFFRGPDPLFWFFFGVLETNGL